MKRGWPVTNLHTLTFLRRQRSHALGIRDLSASEGLALDWTGLSIEIQGEKIAEQR